ncbi:Biotin transport ATP-binding protein BioM [Corynebacterium atrinae]|uniref:energy-coupling factor ABC transporter ATP-binding protein n=1 Tax=Corynebacterium atrinae TaxID=1336740 RepID=UPI0025B29724|nr:ABC transporter ATP-binding protein [Corynebacterium atrinae]WJY63630.1 Biotin transport ATP-binding protein BioM [Corynebacterium atrinae]
MPTITFNDVSVHFDGDVEPVLQGINLHLDEDRIGIIGANGSGKSTLARLINGLGEPTGGQVLVDDRDVAKHGRDIRRQVGFVFSDAENQIIMPQVRDDVAFSLRRLKLSREERNKRVDAALDRFGLTHLADASPHTLSGGQKQLLALAAVLVIEPDIIIADEPTTLLDLRNRSRIAREFSQLEQQLIVVTHDLDILDGFDRVICLDGGSIVADGHPEEVTTFYRTLMAEHPA